MEYAAAEQRIPITIDTDFSVSQSDVLHWLASGRSEADLAIDALRHAAQRVLGDGTAICHIGYRVLLGII